MHAFDVLGDPVRRRIVELLNETGMTAGQISEQIQAQFGLSQPGVYRHLRVLRENGFATVQIEGTRRLYSLNAQPLADLDEWLEPYRRLWDRRLDALDTEIRRGNRMRKDPS